MNPGDTITVTVEGRELTGILMPNKETDAVILKLMNGYNIGIDKKRIISKKLVKKASESPEAKERKVPKDPSKKNIIVLHTGGTIASKVDYATGGVTARFTAADLISMVPEMTDIANIETELVANMMSEDMMFKDHQKIARAVKKAAGSGANGVIIGHGTDTLSYTAAALAFMFEEIDIPVILVGSQRSSDRGSSDAAANLICAARFIAGTPFTGIGICMHETTDDDTCVILPATKTRKMHTSRRDAFKPVNDTAIARISYPEGKITLIKNTSKGKRIVLKDKMDEGVGILKMHPNLSKELLRFYTEHFKGIIIEGTGLGHGPFNLGKENLEKYGIIEGFIKKGGMVCMTSQCLYGRVHPSVYTNLRRLSNIGCIFCEDMLPETAFIKLSWLLGNYSPQEALMLMTKNMRGEMNGRLSPDHFY